MSDKFNVDLNDWPRFEADAEKLLDSLTKMLPLMRKIVASDEFSKARKEIELGKLVDQYLPA